MIRGHLEERRPGVWRYRMPAPTSPDGKPRQHSRTFPAANLKAAQKQATSIAAEWDAADTARAAIKGTVGELVREWVAFRAAKDSPSTIYRRTSITNRLVADLGHIRLADLTARHLDRWYSDLATTKPRRPALGANTVRHYHAVVKAILEQGYKWDMLPANVADKASPPRRVDHDMADRMPTLAAIRVMLACANPVVRVAVILGAATGCRRGELVGLRWSDLDGGVLHVQRALVKPPGGPLVAKLPKNGKTKRIILPPEVLEVLEQHRVACEAWARLERVKFAKDGLILAHQRADPTGRTPFAPDWLSQEWERLCVRAGVARFNLHGLRHMHGSLLVDGGVSIAAAAGRQGHSVQVFSDRYVHALAAGDAQAAEVIGHLLGSVMDSTTKETA